jgi:hypothetical protein
LVKSTPGSGPDSLARKAQNFSSHHTATTKFISSNRHFISQKSLRQSAGGCFIFCPGGCRVKSVNFFRSSFPHFSRLSELSKNLFYFFQPTPKNWLHLCNYIRRKSNPVKPNVKNLDSKWKSNFRGKQTNFGEEVMSWTRKKLALANCKED